MAFDIETKDGLNGTQFFCGSVAYRAKGGVGGFHYEARTFSELSDEFWGLVSQTAERKQDRVVWVHNLAFDARFLMDNLNARGVEFSVLGRGSMLALIVPAYNVRFVDTVQFLQTSQENAEREFDVDEALRKINCQDLFERAFSEWSPDDQARVRAHCENDVKALLSIMAKFRTIMHDLVGIDVVTCVSAAQLGMKGLKRLLDKPVPNPVVSIVKPEQGRWTTEVDMDKDAWLRQAYRGGRTEVFYQGTREAVTVVDVVSLYPSVLRNYPIPGRELVDTGFVDGDQIAGLLDAFTVTGEHHGWTILETYLEMMHEDALGGYTREEGWLNDVEGFLECHVTPPDDLTYPILPEKRNGKMMFTLIPKTGVWTFPELRHALAKGYAIDWDKGFRCVVFERLTGAFDTYIDTMFDVKSTSKGGRRKAAKLLLNSVIGKFGQRFEHEDVHYVRVPKEPGWEDAFITEDGGFSKVCIETDDAIVTTETETVTTRPKPFMNVALAAYVLAQARLVLVDQFEFCEANGVPVFYCDTDCVHVPTAALPVLEKQPNYGKMLGGWDVEQEVERITYLAPKSYLYRLPGGTLEMKMKGLDRKKMAKLCAEAGSLDHLEKLVRAPITLEPRYLTYKSALLRTGEYLAFAERSKHYTFTNDKRYFLPAGTSTPWTENPFGDDHGTRHGDYRYRKLHLWKNYASCQCPTCGETTFITHQGRLYAGCDDFRELYDTSRDQPVDLQEPELTRDGYLTCIVPGHLDEGLQVRFHPG
jgi:hypothetical protein